MENIALFAYNSAVGSELRRLGPVKFSDYVYFGKNYDLIILLSVRA